MEGAGGAPLRWWDASSQCSFRTSVTSAVDIGCGQAEAEEEATPRPVNERVFVALPGDLKHGKNTLKWALENLVKDGAGVVIVHVHCPAQMIPMMGAKVHYTAVNQKLVSDYRKTVRAKADAELDEYVLMCRRQKVSCEKMIIDKDNVAKGLEECIALHCITKLVMGAAADKQYSKKMKTPKSKTALRLMEAAATFCKIWFTCKGHLVCTREANSVVPAIHPSPAYTDASLSESGISSQTGSVRIHHSESEGSSLNESPRHFEEWSRTEAAQYPPQTVSSTPYWLFEPVELHINGKPDVKPSAPVESADQFGGWGSRHSLVWSTKK